MRAGWFARRLAPVRWSGAGARVWGCGWAGRAPVFPGPSWTHQASTGGSRARRLGRCSAARRWERLLLGCCRRLGSGRFVG